MNSASTSLPVELWREILLFALLNRLLPPNDAPVLEVMDTFRHPCKLYSELASSRLNLRLVCHLWNQIIKRENDSILFVDAHGKKTIYVNATQNIQRIETIEGWRHCRQWPCKVTIGRTGPCPPALFHFDGQYWDPLPLLRQCPNLKVLRIDFASFETCGELGIAAFSQLSHLHLDLVFSTKEVYTLDLSCLVYLGLFMQFERSDFDSFHLRVFPLKLRMPKVTTIHLSGWVALGRYNQELKEMIMSSKDTLVNLLLFYHQDEDSHPILLPMMENLPEFPRLSTFGLSALYLSQLISVECVNQPLPNHSSLHLVLHDLARFQFPSTNMVLCANACARLLSSPGKWFSKVVIPLEWSILEDSWAKIYKASKGDLVSSEYPLSSWLFLRHIDQHDVPIYDQSGVSLREEAGAKLSKRMNRYAARNVHAE